MSHAKHVIINEFNFYMRTQARGLVFGHLISRCDGKIFLKDASKSHVPIIAVGWLST